MMKNKYEIDGDVTKIYLRGKHVCLVDTKDLKIIKKHTWCASNNKYKHVRTFIKTNKEFKPIYLHRLLLMPDRKMVCDHINHNPLDNRRSNLRICTPSQNHQNQKKHKGKYKGVHFDKNAEKWKATITKNYKNYNLGYYKTQKAAALAYNKKAQELHGEFACLNKID